VPVIINELEVIVEEQTDQSTTTGGGPTIQAAGLRATDIVRIVDREAERRARLRAD